MESDEDQSGTLTVQEFVHAFERPDVQLRFKHMGVELTSMQSFCELLDIAENDIIVIEEFVNIVLRAKMLTQPLDLRSFLQENKRTEQGLRRGLRDLEDQLSQLTGATGRVRRAGAAAAGFRFAGASSQHILLPILFLLWASQHVKPRQNPCPIDRGTNEDSTETQCKVSTLLLPSPKSVPHQWPPAFNDRVEARGRFFFFLPTCCEPAQDVDCCSCRRLPPPAPSSSASSESVTGCWLSAFGIHLLV